LTKTASKDRHDVKVAAADTQRTLTGACAAGVGVAIRTPTAILSEGKDEDECMPFDLAGINRSLASFDLTSHQRTPRD